MPVQDNRAQSWRLLGIHSFMAFLASTNSLYKVGFGFVCTKSPCSRVSPISRSQPWRFYSACNNFEAPDVVQLAVKARISLTPKEARELYHVELLKCQCFSKMMSALLEAVPELKNIQDATKKNVVAKDTRPSTAKGLLKVEDYGPKIGQVIDWFGRLQRVNLENVEPAIRADTNELSNMRPDAPIIYEDRDEMIAAVPMLEEPFIKVPKILKNNME